MIKATELRIGNWVNCRMGRDVKVHGIESNWDYVWLNHLNGAGVYKDNVDDIDPIPITEDWLLKFGFVEEFPLTWNKVRNYHQIGLIKFNEFWTVSIAGTFGMIEVKYKHIHQLQNLYFALTGEELEEK